MKLTGRFDTRRDAEMAVERLVQEHGIDRDAVMVAAAGEANSAGVERSGSDQASGLRDGPRHDAALDGELLVVVAIDDHEQARKVEAAFAEFSSKGAA